MALTHLVDTSVLTRLHHRAIREVVEPLAASGRLGRATVSDLELGFSARNAKEWDQIHAALDPFVPISTTTDHLQRALHVQRLLAARSQRGRKIPDLLIAAAAEEQGVVLLHYDADFEHIASATGQAHAWVVRQGSVD